MLYQLLRMAIPVINSGTREMNPGGGGGCESIELTARWIWSPKFPHISRRFVTAFWVLWSWF